MVSKQTTKILKNNINKEFYIVFFAALIMFFLKLCVSAYVYGTNDMTSWIEFSKMIEKFGTFRIYAICSIYNHPPLISWILKFISLIHHETGLRFPYLFRLMPITADFLSVLVIWKLLEKYSVKHKLAVCLLCILNPINFFISAFHGNTDPLFIFFILYALYCIEDNRIILAGIMYGLSICIKIVPIIFIPVFFYFLRDNKQRVLFFTYSLTVLSMVFLPYFIYDANSMIKNIFLYGSLKGLWGTGYLLSFLYNIQEINPSLKHLFYVLSQSYSFIFKIFIFFIEVKCIKFLMDVKRLTLIELSFLTFCLFLVLTPGFGIQYLSWLSYFAIMVYPLLGSVYAILGGVFLYRIYIFWGAGQAPYYANSWKVGPWVGFDVVLDILLWFLILFMLIKFIMDKKQCKPC